MVGDASPPPTQAHSPWEPGNDEVIESARNDRKVFLRAIYGNERVTDEEKRTMAVDVKQIGARVSEQSALIQRIRCLSVNLSPYWINNYTINTNGYTINTMDNC